MAGRRGSVASGHRVVCEAGAEVLRAGGGALDAAVAAGFAACVAEPMFASLGGGGFLLARPADGEPRVLDFFVDTPGRGLAAGALEPHFVPVTVRFPASDQIFHAGLGSVAVPGTLAGLLAAHERWCRLPLAELVAPAAALAREGVALNAHQAYVQGLLEPILTLTERGRALFAREGRVPGAGELHRNPELADFLDGLPEHRGRELYRGALGARVAREMEAGGGLLTAADLAAYRVEARAPLASRYRGRTVLGNPPPAMGGRLVARMLELLEAEWPGARAAPARLAALARVMEEVERSRSPAAGGTTHVSVCDDEGAAASLSLSNGEGSGYLVPGTGIQLNNMLGEDDLHPAGFHAEAPGRRVPSMMSPTVVLGPDAAPLVLGSGGSKRIRSAVVQVLSNVLDLGLPLRAAVEAPRIHWDGEAVQAEGGLPEQALAALAGERAVNRWSEQSLYFGGVHAVAGKASGAGDPRREGCAVVVR